MQHSNPWLSRIHILIIFLAGFVLILIIILVIVKVMIVVVVLIICFIQALFTDSWSYIFEKLGISDNFNGLKSE